jgi:hypothetical protein
MNKKIIIHTLKDCIVCQSFKEKLIANNIQFEELCCDGDSYICDKFETISKCELYPITRIQFPNNEAVLLCVSKEHSQINTTITLNNIVVFYVYSINNMIDLIKNM